MFDSDGVNSCSQGYLYTKNITNKNDMLYHQRSEGHGVIPNKVPLDCDLLIIVDSSTNSVEECKELSKRCDIIILDHHPSDIKNPYATIVNCTMGNYANPNLSGSAMVYKFCKAHDIKYGYDFADNYIDLAGIGIVSDMMDLSVMENRYIVSKCLDKLESGRYNKGVKALYSLLLKQSTPTAENIAYYIAPCINAVIRLGDIKLILDLLTCSDEDECSRLAEKVIEINEERKVLTNDIFKYIQTQDMISDDKLIILDMTGSGYNKNIFGLVANKIAQEYGRPCLFGQVSDGVFFGSARGFGESKLMSECHKSNLFLWNRGHEESHGVSFDIGNLDKINKHMNQVYKDRFKEKVFYYDAKLSLKSLKLDFLDKLDGLCRITGVGFEKPKILIENFNPSWYNKIGKDKNHIKLVSKCPENYYFNVMKFNTDDELDVYKKAKSLDIIGSVGANRYFSEEKGQLYTSKQMMTDIIKINERR